MDTTKWKSVVIPLDIYKNIKKDAHENGRNISGQLRVIYNFSKDRRNINPKNGPITRAKLDLDEREIEIYRMKKDELMTFEAIGKIFDISRERVRVIFNKISEKIEPIEVNEDDPTGKTDLEGALADKYRVSRKELERLLLSLSKENEKFNFKTKIATLQLSKSLENFLESNDLIELPVSEFTENIEKLKIEKYANFSIFYLLDMIKTLENSGYESHLSKIRAHAKKLAKALTQNSS